MMQLYFSKYIIRFIRGGIVMSKLSHPVSFFLTGVIIFSTLFTGSCTGPAIAYKPSGLTSLLAFSSDRDKTVHIYTVKPDGTDIVYTSYDNQTFDGSPMWSPDGTRIAFSSNQSDNFEIWTMNADGSDRKKLTDRKGLNTVPRYSLDGSKIVFVAEYTVIAGADEHAQEQEPEQEQENSHGHQHDYTTYEVMTINTDGTNMTRLTTGATQGAWNSVPTWSPDGSKILFGTNREGNSVTPLLYTMNADGSNPQRFGFPFSIEGTQPDWSPVTNKIVFARGSAAKGDIWVMDAGSPFPGLTAKKLTDNYDNNHSPVWSPDGTQIAFVADSYGDDDIFIMNADGTGLRRVTYDKSSDRHPTWR